MIICKVYILDSKITFVFNDMKCSFPFPNFLIDLMYLYDNKSINPFLYNCIERLSDYTSIECMVTRNYLNNVFENGIAVTNFGLMSIKYEQVNENTYTEICYASSLNNVLDFALMKCMDKLSFIKKCKNCGKYFFSYNYYNTKYCNRIYNNTGKTCKEIGANTVWLKKKNNDPILKLYSKEYKRHFAWIRYGKIDKQDFYVWSAQARLMRDKCINGEITFEKFQDWLQRK